MPPQSVLTLCLLWVCWNTQVMAESAMLKVHSEPLILYNLAFREDEVSEHW